MAISEKNFHEQIKGQQYQLFLIKNQLKPYKKQIAKSFKNAQKFVREQQTSSPQSLSKQNSMEKSPDKADEELPEKSDSVYSLSFIDKASRRGSRWMGHEQVTVQTMMKYPD